MFLPPPNVISCLPVTSSSEDTVSAFHGFLWWQCRQTPKLCRLKILQQYFSRERKLEIRVSRLCYCYSQAFQKQPNISCAGFPPKKLIWSSHFVPAAFCHLPVLTAFHHALGHPSSVSARRPGGEPSSFTYLSATPPEPPQTEESQKAIHLSLTCASEMPSAGSSTDQRHGLF